MTVVHRLRGSGRLLRVRGTRRPTHPEVRTEGGWLALTHTDLVKLVAEELRALTGLANSELPAEMLDSREAVAALLARRAHAPVPEDPYRRSEQSPDHRSSVPSRAQGARRRAGHRLAAVRAGGVCPVSAGPPRRP